MRGRLGFGAFKSSPLAAPKAALAYAIVCGGPAGIHPFAALWLRAHGAPLESLGLILALPLFARIVAAPALAAWAARFSKPWKPVAMLCAVVAAAALLAISGGNAFVSIAAWWVVCFCASACMPLMDAATLDSGTPKGGGLLAEAKGAGALAYSAANICVGLLFAHFGPSWVMIWAGSSAFLAACLIPKLMWKQHTPPRRADVAPSMSRRGPVFDRSNSRLILALLACALIIASHGFNAIAMITWQAQGYGPGLGGVLWATGIVADVTFLWFMAPVRTHIGASRLLILGGVSAIVRWVGFASAPGLPVLFMLQALHAFSFTATCLASVELVHNLSSERERLSTQIMNWSLSTGLCTALGTLSATPLYAALGVRGYFVMSVIAAIGLTVAVVLERRLRQPIQDDAPASNALRKAA